MTSPIDDLDARLIALMAAEPRIGLMEASRRLNVARGTVQARLAKLTDRGVIRSFGPEIDPSKIGYPVLAFVFLEITQGRLIEAIAHLEKSDVLREAMGSTLYGAFLAVRRAEAELFAGQDPDAIAAAHRWRY